jgi:ubiquitin-activating enzyme E1
MDFIASAANIRAINYEIPTTDRLTLKKIAGRIIPAMATTTATVCGFVALEMYKVHSIVPKEISSFQFAMFNLATNRYSLSEPPECQENVCRLNGQKYNLWTKWIIEGDLTLGEFLQAVQDKYSLTPNLLTMDSQIIYDKEPVGRRSRPRSRMKTRTALERKITDLKTPALAPGQNLIFIHGEFRDDTGERVETPPLVLKVN